MSSGLDLFCRSVWLALPPFPLGAAAGRGTKAVSAVGPAISCWKMLLLFKKRMVQLPCRTRHLEMGDSSSA